MAPPAIGTLLRLKGGTKNLVFRGKDSEGKILLYDAKIGVTHIVNADDVLWKPIIVPKANHP